MRRLINRAVACLTCVLILVLTCLPAAAYEPTPEDLIDMGYEYIEDGVYGLPSGTPFPFFMAELATEPQFPDFNPGTDLPWLDMPSYIQEIVEAPLEGLTNNESPKVPFILVSFNGSFANIFAGYNLALGSYLSNGAVRIMNCSSFATYDNSVCYTARYTLQSDGSFTITNSWAQAERTITGDREVLGYFSSNFANTTSFDFYVYGANMIRGAASGSYSSITVSASADGGQVHFRQNEVGFEGMNGQYFSSDALSTYWSYFKPSIYGSVDDSAISDLDAAESELFASNYNPDNFANDFTVPLDGAAVNAVFAVMDAFVQIDGTVFGGILIVLVLGVIALIFNR